MTFRSTAAIRDAMLDLLDTDFPAGSVLEIREGSQPAAVTDAATGTVVATVTTPSSPWAAASAGSKAKANTWEDASADAAGTAGWFRLRNAGDTLRFDGSVTATGGGGDMTLDNVVLALGQQFTITSFTVTMA
jgi:hypothetical protein